jgi:hypothetical protein
MSLGDAESSYIDLAAKGERYDWMNVRAVCYSMESYHVARKRVSKIVLVTTRLGKNYDKVSVTKG